MEKLSIICCEEIFKNGLFDPFIAYKEKLLFTAQGRGTITDEQISRSINHLNDPIQLLLKEQKIIVFEGNHRVCWAIRNKVLIPYIQLSENTLTPHIYPFYILFNDFKRRIGRLDF